MNFDVSPITLEADFCKIAKTFEINCFPCRIYEHQHVNAVSIGNMMYLECFKLTLCDMHMEYLFSDVSLIVFSCVFLEEFS